MPVVIIEMWDGRTVDQKKIVVEGITETFCKIVSLPRRCMLSYMTFPNTIGQTAVSWLQSPSPADLPANCYQSRLTC